MTARAARRVLVVLAATAAAAAGFLLPNETLCPEPLLVELTGRAPGPDGSYPGPDGLAYPAAALLRRGGRLLGCPCLARSCLSLCCRPAGGCQDPVGRPPSPAGFFPVLDAAGRDAGPGRLWQVQWDPCRGGDRYILVPDGGEDTKDDRFELHADGSLLQPSLQLRRNFTDFCVEHMDVDNEAGYRVVLCFDEPADGASTHEPRAPINKLFPLGMLVSVPFLLATFVVYLLIAELRNIHGLTLSAYVLCLVVAYVALATLQIIDQYSISDLTCAVYAYIVHFSFLASFFWLNVMCFDIWWTFGGFRSLHGSVKQRERKKFIMYSIYAWGCAIILTTFCMVMDLVPNIPINFPRPQFGQGSCWFHTSWARAIYFYIPMGLTIICNIVLFLLTAHKISKHKKDTARQLKSSDSRRHDDNKQWFNLYLKLFIVMGINWSMEIVSWLLEGRKEFKYIWYITDLTNTLQGVIIFIIFVWKDKIKRLLMKRFGCQGGNFLTRHSASGRNGCATNSSASRATCVTSAPLHEKTNPYVTDPYKSKVPVTDDSDCM